MLAGGAWPLSETLVAAAAAAFLLALAAARVGWRRGRGVYGVVFVVLLAVLAASPGFDPPALPRGDRVRVALVDVSGSMGPDLERLLTPEAWTERPAARLVVVAFGERAVTLFDGPPGEVKEPLAIPAELRSRRFRRTARLDLALAEARAAAGPSDVVDLEVITDGGIDVGRALARADLAFALDDVAVTEPPRSRAEDAGVRFVTKAATIAARQPLVAELEVSGQVATRRDLAVVVAGQRTPVTLTPAVATQRLRLTVPHDALAASAELLARLDGHAGWDADPRNDRARLPFRVKEAALDVVVTGDDLDRPRPWIAAVAADDLTVRVRRPAQVAPALDEADVVVVDDLSLERSPAAARLAAALPGFVASGGGLLLAGAGRSFGAGGWHGSPLDVISPLSSRPGASRRLVTVCLDRSGSMERDGRFEAAARSVRALLEGLTGRDELRLLAFAAGWEETRYAGGDDGDGLARDLAKLRPAGGTHLAPVLDAALGEAAAPGIDSVVLLLTDGQDTRSLTRENVARWKAAAARGRHALHVLWFDRDESLRPMLEELVSGPGGALVEIDDFDALDKPMLEAARKGLVVAPASVTAPDGRSVELPRLLRTRRRDGATVLAAHDRETAALARAPHGLGHVAAAPFDLTPEAITAVWGGPAGLRRLLASLAAQGRQTDETVCVTVDAGGWRYRLDGWEGAAATLVDGRGARWRLERVGPRSWLSERLGRPPPAEIVVALDPATDRRVRRPVAAPDLEDRAVPPSSRGRAELLAALGRARAAAPPPQAFALALALVALAALALDVVLRLVRR